MLCSVSHPLCTHHVFGCRYQNANAWLEGTCTFVADPAAHSFRVYAGHVQAATPTTWWLDDVAILALDRAVANVIRTTITDFVIRPAGHPRNSSSTFKLGLDYSVNAAPVNVTGAGSFRDKTNTSSLDASLLSSLHASSGGRIRPGATVWVDFDFQPGSMGFHTYDLWRGLTGKVKCLSGIGLASS